MPVECTIKFSCPNIQLVSGKISKNQCQIILWEIQLSWFLYKAADAETDAHSDMSHYQDIAHSLGHPKCSKAGQGIFFSLTPVVTTVYFATEIFYTGTIMLKVLIDYYSTLWLLILDRYYLY